MVFFPTRLDKDHVGPVPEHRRIFACEPCARVVPLRTLRYLLPLLPVAWSALLLIGLTARPVMAHEAWLLTPEQIAAWDARPKPLLFTRLTVTNAAMLFAGVVAITFWLLLAATDALNRSPGLLARLGKLEHYAPPIVRACLALTLVMAALGLHPRGGTGLCEAATLGFPDLELRHLGPGWGWLAAVELLIAAALLLGIHVRAAGLLTLVLTALGLVLFGTAMLAYAGALGGAGCFLALCGGGAAWVLAHS